MTLPPLPPARPRRMRALSAAVAAVAVGTVGWLTSVPLSGAAEASTASANTVEVHADQPFRSVTHVATGSLYGLANASTPADDLVRAIKPKEFVQPPIGEQQQPAGDLGQVWQKANAAGAKVVDRLADYYPGWPYQFSWNTWDDAVTRQIQQVKDSGITNLAAYALWNEPDNTWQSSNGTFEDFWTHTYNLVRSLDPTTPIQGPSFSDNISDMQNFLQNAVATNTVPDVLAWHELESSTKIAGDIAKVEKMEDDLGIARRPVDIEEYAAPAEVGIAGDLVGYIAKFERYGIDDAELAFWNQSGALGDLLTGQGGEPNGAYWLYKWYADMTGQMVTTTPPSDTSLLDAAASVTSDKKELDVVTGGTSGSSTVAIDGLDKLDLGDSVNVRLEMTPDYGRSAAVSTPITVSDATYQVAADGSISVPVVMNAAYAYHVVVTRAGSPAALAGTYTLTNVNSGLALDAAGSSAAAGTLVDQSTPDASRGQSWTLVSAGSGLYKIVNEASEQVLGIADASNRLGAPAAVSANDNSDDTLWQLVPDGRGDYRLANDATGLVLGVDQMSKSPGAQVIQWTDGAATSACTADGARQPGKIGSAWSTCQTSAYVKLPTGVVSSLTGDYTVSAWVNPSANSAWSRLFDIGTGPAASMFLTLNDGNEIRYAITSGGAGGEQRIDGTETLPLNQWSLVTVTLAGTIGTLYVNGVAVGTNSSMTNHPSAFGQSTANYIGKSQYGTDAPLSGSVDDFNIYDRALSASEVADLASGTPGAGDVVHYAFDEPRGGTTVVDSSANGSNATIEAGSTSTPATTATDAATADHFWRLNPVQTSTLPPVGGQVATAMSVKAAPASTSFDKAVTVSVKVASSSGSTPTGSVKVTDGGKVLATPTLVKGVASVRLPVSLAVGTHTIRVAYAGNEAFAASSGGVVVTVTKAGSRTRVSVSPKKVRHGKHAAVRVKLSAPLLGGRVRLTVRRTGPGHKRVVVRRTIEVPSSGHLRVRLKSLRVGKYRVRAVWSGTASVAGSADNASFKVRR